MFFWNSLDFSMIQWMFAIWSLIPLPFLNQPCTWKFLVHVLLKPNLKNFLQVVVIRAVKSVVNEAEVDVFLEFPWFFYDPMDVDNLISGSFAFSKSSLNIWKFSVHMLLKSNLKDLKHYFASMWTKHNCIVLWTFFGIALLWDRNENWTFQVLWPLVNFPNMLTYWVQHFNSIMF